MPLPTFLIVGAQKCGTTTLAATLRQHPQITMARPKELHFFDRRPERGLDWYAEQFKPNRRTKQWGEATPAYMYLPETREAIHEAVPQARLVVILRDPVKRAYSHFWHTKRKGREDLDSFEEALALEPERLATGTMRERAQYSYVDRGHYVDQLEALARLYGRDRLHVLLLDDLIADRDTTLEQVLGFLGVDASKAGQLEEKWKNRYRVAEKPDQAPTPVAYPPLDPQTRERLAEVYAPSNERLAAWLGRDLPGWTRP
ncbi:sulfotransferase domain-containing protein [Mumia flava]|uniref:Sulfotransferase domain-containing protein n=1 Tax=Mumia flava TaxID=1348852 RepID=A0A2M9BEN5_9ACTN|nr:sulfotransferase [Mumia flava]PJJ56408.1 sulfotransferase domain-containing protein [Mumia flava]